MHPRHFPNEAHEQRLHELENLSPIEPKEMKSEGVDFSDQRIEPETRQALAMVNDQAVSHAS